MKKRKFFSLFAILFVAVFAFSCCFFAACGDKDENDDIDTDIEQDDSKKEEDPGSGDVESGEGSTTDGGESGDGSGSGGGNIGSGSTVIPEDEAVVKVYSDKIEQWGEENSGYYADFENPTGLSVSGVINADGTITYTFEGTVSLMTEEQVEAFNVGPDDGTKNGATTSDGFIIIEIVAAEGYTVDYNGTTQTVEEGETSVVFIQMVRSKSPKTVSIYDDKGEIDSTFTIVLANLILPEASAGATAGIEYTMEFAVDGEKVTKNEGESTETSTKYSGDFKTTYSGEADAAQSVTISYTSADKGLETGFNLKEKSTEDSSATYKYYVETKNDDRYFTITVGEYVESATITVYTSHTTKNSTRSLYVGTTLSSVGDNTYTDKVEIVGGDNSPSDLYTISATATGGDTLYVYAGLDSENKTETVHVYAIVITYTLTEAE